MNWLVPLITISGAALALAVSCSDADVTEPSTGSGPCPVGVCTGGAAATTSAGGNGSGGSASTSTSSNTCIESWSCTPWETNGDDNGTRTCLDLNECGTEMGKPIESATLPALDENYYRCNVEPVFDRLCGQLGCHGVEPDLAAKLPGRALRTYSRGRLRISGETWTEPGCLSQGDQKPSEDCIGSIECYCWTLPHSDTEWQRNYDAARGFGLATDGTPLSQPEDSELLVQPLIGTDPPAHAGMKMWKSTDNEYQVIRDWLAGTTAASCSTTN